MKAAVTVAVALSLFSFLPATPVEGHPPWNGITFTTPTEGMVVDLGHGNLTFEGTDRHLAGHHEWRDVAEASFLYAGHDFTDDYRFDLVTGNVVSSMGFSGSFDQPRLFLEPITDVVYDRVSHDQSYGHGIHISGFLPESALWGRSVWPGASWTIPQQGSYCEAGQMDMQVDGSWNGTAWEDLVATLTSSCVHGDWSNTGTYTLRFDDPDSPIASERIHNLTAIHSNGTTHEYGLTRPATVTEQGGRDLPFRGRSDTAFWAARDQFLDYGLLDLFPHDPDPHPSFDIAEAGQYALGLEDEEVRVFLARAEEVRLLDAQVRVGAHNALDWSLGFADDKGNSLNVDMRAYKLAGMLIVTDHRSHASTSSPYQPPPADPTLEFAAPGDLARTTDRLFDAQDWTSTGYAWSAVWRGAEYSASYEVPTSVPHAASGTVSSDAATGIVTAYGSTTRETRIDPAPLLP